MPGQPTTGSDRARSLVLDEEALLGRQGGKKLAVAVGVVRPEDRPVLTKQLGDERITLRAHRDGHRREPAGYLFEQTCHVLGLRHAIELFTTSGNVRSCRRQGCARLALLNFAARTRSGSTAQRASNLKLPVARQQLAG